MCVRDVLATTLPTEVRPITGQEHGRPFITAGLDVLAVAMVTFTVGVALVILLLQL